MLRRVNWKVALLFLIVAGGLGYVAPKLLPEQLSSRLTEGTKAHTFTGRVEIWQAGLRGWLESPLLGYGTGSYPEISQRNGSEHMVAHNTWINVLVEVGFIGLFLFMLIWITVLWRIWRAPRLEQMLCAGLVASYLPITISGSQEYQKILWLIFILILSLTAFPATSSQSPPAGTAVPYQRPRLGNTGG
jgi:O-antigen ligase